MPIFTVVKGRITLPAFSTDGMPSTPVTVNSGRQLRLSSASQASFVSGSVFPCHG